MKNEASRDRARDLARVNANVRKGAHEAVMGSKKATRAYLKGLETHLFDPKTSVQLRGQTSGTEFGNATRLSSRDYTKPSTLAVPKTQRLSMLALHLGCFLAQQKRDRR